MRLALFDRALVADHRARRVHLISARAMRAAFGLPDEPAAATLEFVLGTPLRAPEPIEPDVKGRIVPAEVGPAREGARVVSEASRDAYEAMVARVLEYIRAGDVYQVNLSQRMTLAELGEPIDVYAALRRANPAAYGALLCWGGGAVASASPELFLKLRGDEVLTRPIKGTRPRSDDAALDAHFRAELLESAKDAAELAMIVDLHRNDLGRVCKPGTIRVCNPRRIESHPGVHHTVADVAGRLAPGRNAIDLLAACFPAGSISGVPKVRALEIIRELEPSPRGVYTGTIVALGADGSLSSSVAIRTLQLLGEGRGYLHVGGGVVVDSEPGAEYDETLTKARGILRALRAFGGSSSAGAPCARTGRKKSRL